MKVLKFGGTSVGTSSSLMNVKKIAENINEPAIIVVSALGGLTDKLISTAHKAAQGDNSFHDEMNSIAERHYNIINEVIPSKKQNQVKDRITPLLEELSRLYDGLSLIRDLPEKTLDVVVSFGERMSSIIVANMIEGAEWHNSPEFIKTEKWFNKNIADTALTNRLIIEEFRDSIIGKSLSVTGGFISTDRDSGEITNLGRGGSDYTAALIAAALNADSLEIWTDVDGFMTADPRIIKDATVVSHLTFIESMELCTYGAKVIYPPTIYPVFHKNIPIKILNTFNPEAPGTLITDKIQEGDRPVKGISSIKNTVLVMLCGELTANVAEINSRTYNCLARNGISVHLVSPPAREGSFALSVSKADSTRTINALQSEFAPELSGGELESVALIENLATLAVVGENLIRQSGLGSRIINTLLRNGIEVLASSDGVSATTSTFVVALEEADRALNLVHSLIF